MYVRDGMLMIELQIRADTSGSVEEESVDWYMLRYALDSVKGCQLPPPKLSFASEA
jgi:hypothetical protein